MTKGICPIESSASSLNARFGPIRSPARSESWQEAASRGTCCAHDVLTLLSKTGSESVFWTD
jgi:hypothetical protein